MTIPHPFYAGGVENLSLCMMKSKDVVSLVINALSIGKVVKIFVI
jgi:hypothetical protein